MMDFDNADLLPMVRPVNAVQTRSQARRQKRLEESVEVQQHSEENAEAEVIDEAENAPIAFSGVQDDISEDEIQVPAKDNDSAELSLLKVSREELVKMQKESTSLKEIYEQSINAPNSTAKEPYIIRKDLLFKCKNDHLGNVKQLLVIPEPLRGMVKQLAHESTSSHMGVTKTKDKLLQNFYWPGCYKEIEEFVKTCDSCQKAGKPNEKKKAPLKIVPVIQEVFSKINIDACGPLPETSNGNRYMITAICMSSRFPDAVPVKDITSVSVTDALMNIFSRLGFPREVQTDQGTCFTSALTTEFFERFGIKIIHSSVYHPQSNPVERLHRTIKRLLRVLCADSGPDWERHLPLVLLALRTVTHESTGFSPAELVYGKNLRTPETLIYEHWTEPEEEDYPVTEYVLTLINRLKRCQEVATEKMGEVQVKRKTWYDKNAVKREFRPGDLVLVLATSRANKLAIQWDGPGVVEAKISETNYLVKLPTKKNRTVVYHINMLKPYYKRPEMVNCLMHEANPKSELENEIEPSYPLADSNVFDFSEIVRDSNLHERLTPDQVQKLQELLWRHAKGFSNDPGVTDLVIHDIHLNDDKPVRLKPYKASLRQNEILKKEIQRMLDLHIIELGESDYTSPMILVEAPGKDPRPCIDYRRLNQITRTEFYPLPNLEERIEKVASARFVSVLDLSKGYWQIPLSENAQRLAAFVTSFGTYRPLRMAFGLKNAPYFFSKLMSELLKGCENYAVPYLDDIAIFSESWDDHLKHLNEVLTRICRAKLTIKPKKCKFAQESVQYLGHVVGQGKRRPSEAKVRAIAEFPVPTTKTQIRAFLGLAGYYNKYIPNFSIIAAPLTNALKGKTRKGKVIWTEECKVAFEELKNHLISEPVLHAPDYSQPFIVQTDSSDLGMGVVLSQIDQKGEEHPVLYLSKKFSDVEKRYSTTEKECASIIFAVKKLHYYLDGQPFTIVTDHNPLVWLRSNAGNNPRLMRWSLALQPYEYTVVHRSGRKHVNADTLSRAAVD